MSAAQSSTNRTGRRRQASNDSNSFKPSNNAYRSAQSGSNAMPEKQQTLRPALPAVATGRQRSTLFQFIPFNLPLTRRRVFLPMPTILASSLALSPTATPRRRLSAHSGSAGNFPFSSDRSSFQYRKRWLLYLVAILTSFALIWRYRSSGRDSAPDNEEPSTLVMQPEHINRLWAFEILSGRYPSQRKLPAAISLIPEQFGPIDNPGLPRNLPPVVYQLAEETEVRLPSNRRTTVAASGPIRTYFNLSDSKPQPYSLFPPRPVPHSAIDMDVVMEHCDFSLNRYVRDCLEMLRLGARLDRATRVRRGDAENWRHLYIEEGQESTTMAKSRTQEVSAKYEPQDVMQGLGYSGLSHKDAQGILHLQKSPVKRKSAPMPLSANTRVNRIGSGSSRQAHPTHMTADPQCDPDYPRIFHIFWAGPFTDKPYLAILSFLFTQNLGLDLDIPSKAHNFDKRFNGNKSSRDAFLSKTCRPQMWIWINPGPAASIPNPKAEAHMYAQLQSNPWSAPFLHSRFTEAVKFKLWNTTEQLDGIPELRDSWRDLPLFNSGGVKFGSAPQHASAAAEEAALVVEQVVVDAVVEVEEEMPADKRAQLRLDEEYGRFGDVNAGEEAVAKDRTAGLVSPTTSTTDELNLANNETTSSLPKVSASPTANSEGDDADELFERIGSTSSQGYDRLTVVLSDMARFVLCHRFGGVYLDADTLLLRDWEEIWGWHGAFAYRWSRLEKYNTAVLKLHRNSALGSFLFKTALANGLDFHPMTISRYTKDANVEGLLLRLPDALFDPAWLNTEYYQRDRPPFPYLRRFEDFFDPPKEINAAPLAVGFDGFFKGAFSYHFHNFWWIPFDRARNWPDLGNRFAAGEQKARAKARAQAIAEAASTISADGTKATDAAKIARLRQMSTDADHDSIEDDERDLSWATVLKRTFEAYLRGERPNMYGELISWNAEMSI